MVERRTFGKNVTDEFMIFLCGTFLLGGIGITVEKQGTELTGVTSQITFQTDRIGELGAVIGKADAEEVLKRAKADPILDVIKDTDDRSGVIAVAQEGEHKLAMNKMDGKQDLTALFSFHGIELDNGFTGMRSHIAAEIRIGTADPAGFVQLKRTRLSSCFIADFSGKIERDRREKAVVHHTVEGALADHERILVIGQDMIERETSF